MRDTIGILGVVMADAALPNTKADFIASIAVIVFYRLYDEWKKRKERKKNAKTYNTEEMFQILKEYEALKNKDKETKNIN